jgi:hypothetical protein
VIAGEKQRDQLDGGAIADRTTEAKSARGIGLLNWPYPRKGPSALAFFATVSPSAIAPPPICFVCAITYVIAREKQSKPMGGGAIADGETDAKKRV